MRRIIQTPSAPAAIGPYSQGVVIESENPKLKTIYCSGAIPIDPKTNELVTSSIEDATHLCMKNLIAILAEEDATCSDVVQTTIFMTDLTQFTKMNEVYASYFKEAPPARQTVGVASLPKNAAIEISAIAVKESVQ